MSWFVKDSFEALALVLAMPALLASSYLFVLTVLSAWPARLRGSNAVSSALARVEGAGLPHDKSLGRVVEAGVCYRFDIIVPAHDEATGIAETVQSLLAVEYPAALRRVVVIADNCSDDTALRAREAGATVLERFDPALRGKGYALAAAFEWSLKDGLADAVAVVDADTIVEPNLLTSFSAHLASGAMAVQAHYGVRNPDASWRTRLMTIALSAFHGVRSLGRERLGVSCGLRGNGMCFRSSLLRAVPYDAFSVVEDVEYGLRLGRAGYRVEYAFETSVFGEMVSNEAASRSQRARWEHGRSELRRTQGWPLLRDAIYRRSPLLFDLALDVLMPPLTALTALIGVGLSLSVTSFLVFGIGRSAAIASALSFACVAAYVLGGWWHSRTGARGLRDLGFAPAYMAWKLMLGRRAAVEQSLKWVRTPREERPHQ